MGAVMLGGERHVFFERVMRGQAERRSGLEADLRCALVEKELFMVYQPVVGLQTEPCRYTGERLKPRLPNAGLGEKQIVDSLP